MPMGEMPPPRWAKFGRYDNDIQMYCKADPAEPDMDRLRFLRWLLIHKTTLVGDGYVMKESSGPLVPTPEPEPDAPTVAPL